MSELSSKATYESSELHKAIGAHLKNHLGGNLHPNIFDEAESQEENITTHQDTFFQLSQYDIKNKGSMSHCITGLESLKANIKDDIESWAYPSTDRDWNDILTDLTTKDMIADKFTDLSIKDESKMDIQESLAQMVSRRRIEESRKNHREQLEQLSIDIEAKIAEIMRCVSNIQ